jgi:hypothetical protein
MFRGKTRVKDLRGFYVLQHEALRAFVVVLRGIENTVFRK